MMDEGNAILNVFLDTFTNIQNIITALEAKFYFAISYIFQYKSSQKFLNANNSSLILFPAGVSI